jgi:hypothetical protein
LTFDLLLHNNYITSVFHWNVTIWLAIKWSHDYKRDVIISELKHIFDWQDDIDMWLFILGFDRSTKLTEEACSTGGWCTCSSSKLNQCIKFILLY